MRSETVGLRIAGSIFGAVTILHLLRIITVIPVLIGEFLLPLWLNWMGLFATAFLCIWLWILSLRRRD
ncbi:MAG: hypothetical protein CVU14_05690 [Bacteroidetes bacterium HGW-Bacteroidetes-9]|jgi:hypothetical protein|nr:MAG: hypothetical protein CVU14_05690 [Bacteroidetes bacterium HGW-Bacteroidetes-9]